MVTSLGLIIADAGLLTSAVAAASPTGGAHQIIGIIVAILALSQPVFACCRNGCAKDMPEAAREAAHKRWHILHAVVGGGALWLAVAAVALGLQEISNGALRTNALFIAGLVIFVVMQVGERNLLLVLLLVLPLVLLLVLLVLLVPVLLGCLALFVASFV